MFVLSFPRFCSFCLLKSAVTRLECPLDRLPLRDTFMNESSPREAALRAQINALRVRCQHKPNGCAWTGELQALHEHLKHDCEFKACEFAVFGCGLVSRRNDTGTDQHAHAHDHGPTSRPSQGMSIEEEGADEERKEEAGLSSSVVLVSSSSPSGDSSTSGLPSAAPQLSSHGSSSSVVGAGTVSGAEHSSAHARLLHAHVLTSTESLEALQDQVRDVVRASVPGWERQRLLERNVHVLARDVQSLQQTILAQNQNIQRLVERERARMAREAEQGIMPPPNLQPEGQPAVQAAGAGVGADADAGLGAAILPPRVSRLLYAGLVSGVQVGALVLLAMGIARIVQHGARGATGGRGGASLAPVSDGLFGGVFGAGGGAGSARGDGGAAAIQSVVGAPLHSAAARFTDWMTRVRVDIQSRV